MIKKKMHKKDFKRLTKKKKTRKKTLKISTKPSRSAQPKGGLRVSHHTPGLSMHEQSTDSSRHLGSSEKITW